VQRLDDLLLRRTRLGLQLREGASGLLGRVRDICQPELRWSDARWRQEAGRYAALWAAHYSLPPAGCKPPENDD
jgi:glycerol-3-phosphate dehydrogenase